MRLRLLPCSPCGRGHQPGRRARGHQPDSYSAADGQRLNHLETATVLLASTAPICMGHGAWPHEVAEGQGAGRPSSAIANFSTACSTAARCSFMDMVLTMMEHGATVRC